MNLAHIDIDLIRSPKYLLRPVRTDSVEYAEMLDSIRDRGLFQPILVRPLANGEYEVIEGNWRYTCCKQLGLATIACTIREVSDDDVLVVQLETNGIRPDTTPVQFAERLAQILHLNPGMTLTQLSRLVHKSPSWIADILRMNKLRPVHKKMVSRGELSVTAAACLAKLPFSYQDQVTELAKTWGCIEFTGYVTALLKQIREDSRNEYIDSHRVNQPKPVPYLRKMSEIRAEFKEPTAAGPTLLKTEAETAMDGWNACMAWLLHMDPDGLVDQQRMIEDRHKIETRAAERRRKERRALQKLRKQNQETLHPNLGEDE